MNGQFWFAGSGTYAIADLRLHADKLQLTGDDTGRLLHALLDGAGCDDEARHLRAEVKDLKLDLAAVEKAVAKTRRQVDKLRTQLEKEQADVSILSLLDSIDDALDEA